MLSKLFTLIQLVVSLCADVYYNFAVEVIVTSIVNGNRCTHCTSILCIYRDTIQ